MNMNLILNYMDKIYGDTKMLTIVYVVGAGLLFVFIILLIISIRKPDKKKSVDIIDVDNETKKEKVEDKNEEVEEKVITEDTNNSDIKHEDSIFEKTTIIPLDDINTDPKSDSSENDVEKALDNADNMKIVEEEKEEVNNAKLSSEIPDVDDFVDNVVTKTYEKNDQFSSVYVENKKDDTMKLDKIMDNVDVDESVKSNLVEDDSIEEEEMDETIEEENYEDREGSGVDLIEDTNPKLDDLKKALEAKKDVVNSEDSKDVNEKKAISTDDLKNKLNALKKDNKLLNKIEKNVFSIFLFTVLKIFNIILVV